MKPLKLKKIKISRVGNPHFILAGAQQAAGANDHKTEPFSVHCETQDDNNTTCASQTNTGGEGRTGTTASPMDMNNRPTNFNQD